MYKDNFQIKFHYGSECFAKIIKGIVQIKIHEYHAQDNSTRNEVKCTSLLSELKEDGEVHEKEMEGCHICKSFNR